MTPGFIAPAMPNGTCTHASASIAFGWLVEIPLLPAAAVRLSL